MVSVESGAGRSLHVPQVRSVAAVTVLSAALCAVLTLAGIALNGVLWRHGGNIGEMYGLIHAALVRADPYDRAHQLVLGPLPGKPWQIHQATPMPPTLAMLALPLGLLTEGRAMLVWGALQLASVVVAVRLLARLRGWSCPLWISLLVTGLVMLLPVGAEALTETQFTQVALIAASLVLWREERRGWSAAALVVAIALKPWILPLGLLLLKDRRAFIGGALTAGLITAATVLWLTPRVIFDYLSTLPRTSAIFHANWDNLSLWSVTWKVFSGTRSGDPYMDAVHYPPLIHDPALAALLAPVLPVVVLALLAWQAWRAREVLGTLTPLLVGSLLCSPIVWLSYWTVVVVPFCARPLRDDSSRRADR